MRFNNLLIFEEVIHREQQAYRTVILIAASIIEPGSIIPACLLQTATFNAITW